MKTSMTYSIRFGAVVVTGVLLFSFSSVALGGSCKFEKNIDLTLDLADSQTLSIYAAAGELDVSGVSGSDQAVIKGKVCASKEEWLEDSNITRMVASKRPLKSIYPAVTKAGPGPATIMSGWTCVSRYQTTCPLMSRIAAVICS